MTLFTRFTLFGFTAALLSARILSWVPCSTQKNRSFISAIAMSSLADSLRCCRRRASVVSGSEG